MPFYFENVYIPATFWRHLETYTEVYGRIAQAGGLGGAFVVVANVVGRGILVSIGNNSDVGTDMRITIDGGVLTGYPAVGEHTILPLFIGFSTSCLVEVWRSNAFGCDGVCTLLVE